MTSTTAIPPTKALDGAAVQPQFEYLDEQDAIAHAAADERWQDTRARERREHHIARVRAKLDSPKARVVYHEIAYQSPNLTDAEYRVLSVLLGYANGDLTNCFPSRKATLAKLGGKGRSAERLKRLLHSLVSKGWIERRTLPEDDQCLRANDTGRFISAVGTRFCLPPDELAPGEPGWRGPWRFDNRLWGQRRARGYVAYPR